MTIYVMLQPPEAPRALYVFDDKTDLQGYIRTVVRLSPLPLPKRHTIDDLLHLLRAYANYPIAMRVYAARVAGFRRDGVPLVDMSRIK